MVAVSVVFSLGELAAGFHVLSALDLKQNSQKAARFFVHRQTNFRAEAGAAFQANLTVAFGDSLSADNT